MIIVYRYGLLAPTLNGDKVAEQMSAAHRYYNKLVEIERKLRAEISEALEPHETPAAKEIRAKMAELHQERRAIAERLKAQDASESATIPEDELNGLRHRLAKIEEEREALSKSLGKANKPLYELPAVKESILALREQAKAQVREARAHCNVYWGTYQQIEAAIDQAKASSFSPDAPKYKAWSLDGRITVSAQGKECDIDGLTSCADTLAQLQLTPAPVPTSSGKERTQGNPLPRLRVRIGSNEKRGPVFAEWPIKYHRPLPPGSKIKLCTVNRRSIGTHIRWYACFTIETSAAAPQAPTQARPVAVNLRWALARPEDPSRIIAADWHDGTTGGELIADEGAISQMEKSTSLQSIRDRELNSVKLIIKNLFNDLLKSLAATNRLELATEHKERLGHVHLCRSTRKLAGSIVWWRAHRLPGDDRLFAEMERWRKQDKHLLDWQACSAKKALNRRKNGYRTFAAKLADTYDILLIDNLNIAALAKKPEPEEERKHNKQASRQRFAVSCSELRLVLENAFKMRGKAVVKIPAGMTSQEMVRFHASGESAVLPTEPEKPKKPSRRTRFAEAKARKTAAAEKQALAAGAGASA